MVLSYIRLRCSLDEAKARYGRWIGKAELAPPRVVPERDAIDLSLKDGDWMGIAVFLYPADPWTVIEEISGGLGVQSDERWLELAQGGDLVYAAANDAVPYAEVIVIEGGRLVRRYLQDVQDSSSDVDIGRLPEEAGQPFGDWIDAMAWVETDEEKLTRPKEGWLWIHRAD
jgi:hypothetical protein